MTLANSAPQTTYSPPSSYAQISMAGLKLKCLIYNSRNGIALDLHNLIEEIESLGKQQRQELRNRLSVLIGHPLKWQYQPKCPYDWSALTDEQFYPSDE